MLEALSGRSPLAKAVQGKDHASEGGGGGGKVLASKSSCPPASRVRQGCEASHPVAAEKVCGTKMGKVLASKGVKVLPSKAGSENNAKAHDGANLKKRASSEQTSRGLDYVFVGWFCVADAFFLEC